jgi:hypothetical protein
MKRKALLAAVIGLLVLTVGLVSLRYWAERYWEAEALGNLSAIRIAQEIYKEEHGMYVECNPNATADGLNGFARIGFSPSGETRFRYAVAINSGGFVATATDTRDGKRTVYKIDSIDANYPEITRIDSD